MNHRKLPLVLLLSTTLLLFLMGCASATPATESGVMATIEPIASVADTAPVANTPEAIAVVEPTAEVAPETVALTDTAPTIAPESDTTDSTAALDEGYLDDRSSGEAVVRSLFNAINSRQYLRAYSYWEADAEGLPSFEEFAASFAETDYVDLFNVGDVLTEAGAGQQYFAVPYIISVRNTDESVEAFAGCYLMHLANPAIQATPPFQPLAIRAAAIRQMDEGDDSYTISEELCADLMAQ